MMRSVASAFHSLAMGIIMTGMGVPHQNLTWSISG